MFQLINGNTEYRVRRDTNAPVTSGEVSIPAYHRRAETGEYLPVREIGSATDSSSNGAFYNTRITIIHIPETVTVIGGYAFATSAGSTSYLTTVDIEEGSRLLTVGNYAFSNCSDLTGITLPEGVTAINQYAFQNCTSLTEITIPENITTIGTNAFSGCTNLTDIIIDNDKVTNNSATNWGTRFPANNLSVTFKKDIGNYDFYSSSANTRLTSVTLDEGVTSIGTYAFYNCSGLTGITISENVTTIGTYAFYNCTNLTNIIIDNDKVTTTESSNWGTIFPASNLSVTFKKNPGSYAFYFSSGNTRLTSITFAEGVTSIGGSAFYYCTGLTGITIPEGVTSINFYAFYNCTGITSITIPASVTSIGGGPNNGLASITVDANNPNYASQDGIVYNKAKTQFVFIPSRIISVTIPDGVTSIDDYFIGLTSLRSVTFAAGSQLTTIGNTAFQNCTSLTSITIPENVTTIGTYAFNNCTNLRRITIDNDKVMTNWGTIFPANNLEVTFKKNIGSNAFYNSARLIGVVIYEGVTSIDTYAFYNCSGLTSVTIGTGVTSIGEYAFAGTGLTSITIPENVTTIGNSAFDRCVSLTNIIINNDKVTITQSSNWGNMFYWASNVTFKKNVPDYAFYTTGNSSRLSVTIEAGVTSIGNSASQICTSVTFAGTIDSGSFSSSSFPGDLRDKFYATDSANGTPGTYTRPSESTTWTRQE